MRTLTLNLDAADARVLLQTVEQALGSCRCATGRDGAPCPECTTLRDVAQNLSRMTTLVSLGVAARRRSITGPVLGHAHGE